MYTLTEVRMIDMVYGQKPGYGGNRGAGNNFSGSRNGGGNFGGGNTNLIPDDVATVPYKELTEDNYVEVAETAITALSKHVDKKNKPKILTTSKIRNILALNTEIYNDILNEPNEVLSDEFKGRINYLKVRMIYEAGREESVKCFVTESHLLEHIRNIQGNRSKYMLFSRFLEALVAFKKYKFKDDEKER